MDKGDDCNWTSLVAVVGVGVVVFFGLMESLRLSKAELASSTEETGGEMDEEEEADDDEEEEEEDDDVLISL